MPRIKMAKKQSKSEARELIEINKMRKDLGLKPIVRGYKTCIKCGDKFYAMDKTNEYLCLTCKKYASNIVDMTTGGYR